jgi:hypothetical protein
MSMGSSQPAPSQKLQRATVMGRAPGLVLQGSGEGRCGGRRCHEKVGEGTSGGRRIQMGKEGTRRGARLAEFGGTARAGEVQRRGLRDRTWRHGIGRNTHAQHA